MKNRLKEYIKKLKELFGNPVAGFALALAFISFVGIGCGIKLPGIGAKAIQDPYRLQQDSAIGAQVHIYLAGHKYNTAFHTAFDDQVNALEQYDSGKAGENPTISQYQLAVQDFDAVGVEETKKASGASLQFYLDEQLAWDQRWADIIADEKHKPLK